MGFFLDAKIQNLAHNISCNQKVNTQTEKNHREVNIYLIWLGIKISNLVKNFFHNLK